MNPVLPAFSLSPKHQQHADKNADSRSDEQSSHRLASHVLDDVLRNLFDSTLTVTGQGIAGLVGSVLGQSTGPVKPRFDRFAECGPLWDGRHRFVWFVTHAGIGSSFGRHLRSS